MTDEGTLQQGEIVPLLEALATRQVTGLLTLHHGGEIVAAHFSEGAVVWVTSMTHSLSESIGHLLARRGLVSPQAYQQALDEDEKDGSSLFDRLSRRQIVGHEELLETFRAHIYRTMLGPLRWADVQFQLDLSDRVDYESGIAPLGIEELLVRSIADLGLDGPLLGPLPDIDQPYSARPPGNGIKLLGEDEEAEGDEDSIWLTRTEREVLDRLDGATPVRSLMSSMALGRYEIEYAVYRLRRLGLAASGTEEQPEPDVETSKPPSPPTTTESPPLPPFSLDSLRLDTGPLATSSSSPDSVSAPLSDGSGEPRSDVLGSLELTLETDGEESAAPAPQIETPPSRPATSVPGRKSEAPWWLGGTIGLLAALLVLGTFALDPRRSELHLPFPWLERSRLDFERTQRFATYQRIERAISSYYLLFGRYPEDLDLLVDQRLLDRSDLYDPVGRWIRYTPRASGYLLQPLREGQPVPGLEGHGRVAADFLLNPQFVERDRDLRGVLLLD